MLRVALDGDDVDGFRFVGMDVYGEAEIGREVPADLYPGLAGVVGAHDVPVLLHVEDVWTRWMHREAVNAMADLRVLVRDGPGTKPPVLWSPRPAAVVGAEHTSSRYRDEYAIRVARIHDDRVQAHPTGSRLP